VLATTGGIAEYSKMKPPKTKVAEYKEITDMQVKLDKTHISPRNLIVTNTEPDLITTFKIQDQSDEDFAQEAAYTLVVAPTNPIPKNGAVRLTLPDNLRFAE
jgi:hypothetical protein